MKVLLEVYILHRVFVGFRLTPVSLSLSLSLPEFLYFIKSSVQKSPVNTTDIIICGGKIQTSFLRLSGYKLFLHQNPQLETSPVEWWVISMM